MSMSVCNPVDLHVKMLFAYNALLSGIVNPGYVP